MVAAALGASTVNSGFILVCLWAGGLVLLWPIYRRILFGLGTMFALFGACLLVVLLAGGQVEPSKGASFLAVGLSMRIVGGFRPAALTRRSRRRAREQPA